MKTRRAVAQAAGATAGRGRRQRRLHTAPAEPEAVVEPPVAAAPIEAPPVEAPPVEGPPVEVPPIARPPLRERLARARSSFGQALVRVFRKDGLEAADWALAARASYAADLPTPVDWIAEAQKDKEPVRKRSIRYKLRRY